MPRHRKPERAIFNMPHIEMREHMEPKALAKHIAKILSGKKAADIRLLEVADLTALADFFIIATGTSAPHLKTLAEEVEFVLKKENILPGHIEGRHSGSWVLLDYGSVVVHLLMKDAREFYSIERLWADAKQYSEDEL
ncbi:MAG: ribosome silencing factor [Oscillospiraceae bacterium]|jgi:ribosome-associated protein|nr:ribosome silencing factor [Oscillospiraceae bacterium]